MQLRSFLLGALVSCATVAGAQAATINGTFTGTLYASGTATTSLDGPLTLEKVLAAGSGVATGILYNGFSVAGVSSNNFSGQTITGTFTFDASGLRQYTGTPYDFYTEAGSSFGVTLTVPGYGSVSNPDPWTEIAATEDLFQNSGIMGVGAYDANGDVFAIGEVDDALYALVAFPVDGSSALYDWAVLSLRSVTTTTVPEPLSVLLLASGVGGLWAVRRRRRAAA